MNLISLYYFTELAKELHMTNTAQKLYITQQNLSQHIQRLEQYYGVELFYRKPKLSLTYAGEQFLLAAGRILSEENDLKNRLSDISLLGAGNLKIGIPSYRGEICLPSILPRFHELWPYVSIQLVDTSSEVMEQMVFDGELDLYIGIKYTADPHLEILPLLDDNLFLVVSDSLMVKQLGEECGTVKRQSAGGVKLKEFKDFPFLLPKPPMRLRKMVDQCFLDAGFVPKVFLESSTTELLISLYPYDYGAFFCTQMSLPLLAEKAPDANTFPLMLNGEPVRHRLVLAYHKDRYLPKYMKDFIDITRDVFADLSDIRLDKKADRT